LTADTADDPKAAPTYRALKAVVILLGVLIVAAFGALIIGGAMKLAGHRSAPPQAALASDLPADAKILSLQTTGNRIVVALRTPQGDEIDIFDAETGKPVARIRAVSAGGPK